MRWPRNSNTEKPNQRRLRLARSLLFCVALLAGCAASPSGKIGGEGWSKVDGLVSLQNKSFAGASISIRSVENFSTEASPVETAVSDDKGRFTIAAPPGDYIVTASSPGYFAYFGRNPLRLNADQKNLSLPLAKAHAPESKQIQPGGEGLEGRVLFEGAPVEGAVVQAYLEAKNGFRGQPYASALATGPEGGYALDLEPGRYFIVAKRRHVGHKTGPLEAGDLFGALPGMPLALATGNRISVDLETVRLPSAEMMARYQTKFATISGVIVDEKGQPVAGFRPCLYPNSRMLDEPLVVGEPTGAEGLFTLRTSRTGAFWVGAREQLGGPPREGERIGFMRPFPAEGISISPGDAVVDVTVVVRPAP